MAAWVFGATRDDTNLIWEITASDRTYKREFAQWPIALHGLLVSVTVWRDFSLVYV